MSEIDSLTMLSDVADLNEADDIILQMSQHHDQLRQEANSTPFDTPLSVNEHDKSPFQPDQEPPSPRAPHRLSVVAANFSPPRINKRKQSQPHRSIRQLASLAEKMLHGIVVIEHRSGHEAIVPTPKKTIHLKITESTPTRYSGNGSARNNARRRDELKVIFQSPISDHGRSPSPDREIVNASPASNPNSKIATVIGKHIESDFEATALASREELYLSIYQRRKSPGTITSLGSNRMSGFAGTPLNISEAPGASLLEDSEFELCSLLRLQPLQYFLSRATLIRNYRERGFYRKSAAQKMLHIDVNKTGRLYDYFVMMKWMPESEDPAAAEVVEDPPEVDWEQLIG